MSAKPNSLDLLATKLVEDTRARWVTLVDLALSLSEERVDGAATELSKHMGESKDSLRRKIMAIKYAHSLAHSNEDIKSYGQEWTLSRYVKKTNSDRYEKSTVMKWNLPGSLREVIRQDMAQVAKILGFVTSEELWDFLHSILDDLVHHPDDLKHLAGELKGKDAQTRTKA